MPRRRNPPSDALPLIVGVAALGVAVYFGMKGLGGGSSSSPDEETGAQLNDYLQTDTTSSDAPGTVLPGGSVVLQ